MESKKISEEKNTDFPLKRVKKEKSEQPKITSFIKHTSSSNELDLLIGDGKIDKNNILISSWNVNGLRAIVRKGDLQKYIKEINPDILCFNEIKIGNEIFHQEKLKNVFPQEYFQIWNYSKVPGYSGVGIISKYKPIRIQYDLLIEKHDGESRTLIVEFDKFYLVSCYVPNAGSGLKRLSYRTEEWDKDFTSILVNLKSKKHVILAGDLNCANEDIDIANPKTNHKSPGFTDEERSEFKKLLDSGFVDTFRKLKPDEIKYSWFSPKRESRKNNIGWRIDYFLVDNELYDKNVVEKSDINNEFYGSDHLVIELKLNMEKL